MLNYDVFIKGMVLLKIRYTIKTIYIHYIYTLFLLNKQHHYETK